MPYTQDTRRLNLQTPLGENVLLIRSITGTEAISRMFHYQIDAIAELTAEVNFNKLLGRTVVVSVALSMGRTRYIHGVVHRITQGERNTSFNAFLLEIGPPIWTLTKRIQSRIFQQRSVPEILRIVLGQIDCGYQISGTFEPREFCVQYNESDFHFFSRLCEEEGIYYFFQHDEAGCKLILANTPQSHPPLPHCPEITYRPQSHYETESLLVWEKTRSLRSGKVTLRDHHGQLPGRDLEAIQTIQPKVTIGRAVHELDTACAELEQYRFPGGYAERFDGIGKSGGIQTGNLQKIFEDNVRTAGIRMQQESAEALVMIGHADFVSIVHGHRFTLREHPTDNDMYVVTECNLFIPQGGSYGAGKGDDALPPDLRFTCIPLELPFRPPSVTPKPQIVGAQTAFVVGPPGEEIFVDKYGRVKVAFYWDRDAKANETSSCWIRVAQGVAGKQWGTFWVPRIGQEVIVSFLEGDPDRPIITGAVYNSDCMPPYALPANKTRSTIKTNSTVGGGGFNEIRFEDKKSKEQVFVQAERDLDIRVKHDAMQFTMNNHNLIVGNDQLDEVRGNRHVILKGDRATRINGSDSLEIGADQDVKIQTKYALETGMEIHMKSGMKLILEAGCQISLKVGESFIDISPNGISITGKMVKLNSGGAAGSGSGASPDRPHTPKEAANDRAGQSTVPAPRSHTVLGPQALAFQRAAKAGKPFCEVCQRQVTCEG